ncbi:ORF6N domain-containing protein [Salmonella enterica subsp. salamae]|nr:ORF6N domain-containing protein [Salmonella enterica subsp. salamae]
MTTQISVETLSPITHNQIPVITTELLARFYATKAEYIRRNHNRNEGRFIEGKHFFIAKGETLEKLKKSLRPFQEIAPNVRKLILWTERGAARHAKMLETDQA